MTETAMVADIVLPATMFLEHDDVYQGGGHQHIILGPKIIDPPEGCRSNHEVICELAHRLGAKHQGFHMSARELIDQTLQDSGWGSLEQLERSRWIDCQPAFEEAHYVGGFAHKDKKYHFSPDWTELEPQGFGPKDSVIPKYPDHVAVIEESTADMPFRLVTAPARHYLNSSFNETPTSIRREKQPAVMVHPEDLSAIGVHNGDEVRIGNSRGELTIAVEQFEGVQKGVVIVESIWPNRAFKEGKGINVLTGADPIAPTGGAAFHDNRIWIRPL
jgi:anaerobic selenocysteine-containing dehydrogenase